MKDVDTSPVLKAMQVFFLENIPETLEDLAIYGEHEVAILCNHFNSNLERANCQVDEIFQTEWPALKMFMFKNRRKHKTEHMYKKLFSSSLKEKFRNILMLIEIILVIPTSSAICERGFSAMKKIKTDWRAGLQSEMIDNLMAISLSGPPIEEYDCSRALSLWWNGGQRKRRPQFTSANDFDLDEFEE